MFFNFHKMWSVASFSSPLNVLFNVKKMIHTFTHFQWRLKKKVSFFSPKIKVFLCTPEYISQTGVGLFNNICLFVFLFVLQKSCFLFWLIFFFMKNQLIFLYSRRVSFLHVAKHRAHNIFLNLKASSTVFCCFFNSDLV